MTLKFHKLAISNFGPYLGKQDLLLDTSDDSPVVVIHGENTLGKTQLFSALRWCLYGTFRPHQSSDAAMRELPGRLNSIAKDQGDTSLEVSIDFESAGSSYHLVRRAKFFKDGDRVHVTPDLRIDAAVIPASSVEIEIGRVLHPQISEFFLFDAELLETFYERLATERERDLIRSSIEAVLGIPALQVAQHDLEELATEALTRQAKLIENRSEADRIRKRLAQLSSETKSIEADVQDLSGKMDVAQRAATEVREKLKVIEGLQADVREQETLEANIADGEREEAELVQGMKQLLSSGWRALSAQLLTRALDDIREKNSEVNRRNRSIANARSRVDVLVDQAKGGVCPTCRQTLPPPGPETEEELVVARSVLEDLLEATGGGEVDLDTERRLAALVDTQTIPQYIKANDRLVELRMLQYQRQQRIDGISDRLQGHKAADIRALANQGKELDQAIESIRQAQLKNTRRADAVAKEQAKLARELQRLPGAAGSTVSYETSFYRFVERLLVETIEAFRESVRSKVQADSQTMFLKLIRDPEGYGGLRISSDYTIELLDTRGNPRETSQGGKQLLALSLIGALKRAAVRGGPVVLDSPLGRLDLEHRVNVLQTWVPSLGAQAILLVQSGELTKTDARQILGTLIGREYEILRPTNNPEHAILAEVE